MQSELRKILRDHCDHSCVMRTGRDFAENDIFALNKQFDPENTAAAERSVILPAISRAFSLATGFIACGCRIHDSRRQPVRVRPVLG